MREECVPSGSSSLAFRKKGLGGELEDRVRSTGGSKSSDVAREERASVSSRPGNYLPAFSKRKGRKGEQEGGESLRWARKRKDSGERSRKSL